MGGAMPMTVEEIMSGESQYMEFKREIPEKVRNT